MRFTVLHIVDLIASMPNALSEQTFCAGGSQTGSPSTAWPRGRGEGNRRLQKTRRNRSNNNKAAMLVTELRLGDAAGM